MGPRGLLALNPSPLRPQCAADQRLHQWIGVNTPAPATIGDPIIRYIETMAARASLRDAGSYGSGLRKFHVFCDIFSIPESDRLPAAFPLLHSFALWAATDPAALDPVIALDTQFEPVSDSATRKYLASVRAWHIVQGWPPPLSDTDHARINWSLRGLVNMQGARKRPIRPPITIPMLRALKAALDLVDPFDASVWAMAACSFWGLMRFGEVSVTTRTAFNTDKHITRGDVFVGQDQDGNPYARLDLPSAKTAKPGDIQSIFLVEQGDLCPLEALRILSTVVPASASDPLFSWRDKSGTVRPMVKSTTINRINAILAAHGWGTTFGHSFRIGGASYFLALGVDPEIVRIHGRWRSLAYEVYVRAFELVASRHLRRPLTA
ncbi:DNA breaking-rejoining enzyme [Athelia psychrophila]|uniref:DNA breaking-rejoining enzyme n=1 Tax=Athelia psychrophila TaxID=1759441 RepID=A0A165YR66_9AGAM|nr:DNA breaking-rejoining enzyme [Fibularhizoctonia sp. CBS 109695]